MSYPGKKKEPVFLLGKLKPLDYLLISGVILLFVFLFALLPRGLGMLNTLNSALEAYKVSPQLVPARSIQATHNLSPLWNKDEFYVANVDSLASLFFTVGAKTLIYPAASKSDGSYTHTLEAIDSVTGQIQWQTGIPNPTSMSMYDGKFFVLSLEWLDQAPTRDTQELPYCSFGQKQYSLSAYDIYTGRKEWGYGYQGVNINIMYFVNQSVFLQGSLEHGTHGFLVNIDKNSGFIIDQRCNGPNLAPPLHSGGIYGPAFHARSIDVSEDFGCSGEYPLCFISEGNRLHVQDRNSKEDIAFIDFEGAELTHYFIDVVIQGNIIVLHLLDSHQLFAFRLP